MKLSIKIAGFSNNFRLKSGIFTQLKEEDDSSFMTKRPVQSL
jgi:hypothetical protein